MFPDEIPLLSLVTWVPILGGLWVLFAAGEKNAPTARAVALVVSIVTFLLSVPLYTQFDLSSSGMQFVEKVSWIEAFNINYHLGVDGIAMPLILLTTFITVLVIIAGWESIQYKVAQYMAAFLLLEGFMNGVFAAMDAMLFYVFWEAMLIPMFLIIGIWGGPNRIYATIKFFLYTFLGSVFLLVALLYLYSTADSFLIQDMHAVRLGMTAQTLIFLAFLLAFAVKVPMWPVHTWLPDAHVEAPTGGSVILAAIMLKMGGYGFIRFSLPITPDASKELDWLMIALSLIAIVYIGFVAIAQKDLKKLIAYSSIAHMGFVTLGFFIVFGILEDPGSMKWAVLGVEGGLMQLISHGRISGALFLCV
ncbi:MAG: NADH-quinone oxidoreductase subunit M, partial [Gammaproteobacteria bacterium]|nr:NADH-quinone oxidoreductase subunit M [Gammaproteobacteria bacterium]